MRRAVRLWSVGVLIFLLIGHAQAAPLQLDIDAAVTQALAANRFGARRVDFARSNLKRSKAWLPANPFLSGGAQHTTQAGIGPNYVFLLSQEFEIAGQRSRRIAVAKEGLERATWEAKSNEQDLIAAVKVAFVQALVSNERVTLAQQNLDVDTELVHGVGAHGASSDAQRLDFNVARIQESHARRELAAAEQARERAYGTVRRLVGVSPDQPLELTGATEQAAKQLPPTSELIERALQHRPDLAALQHGRNRTDRQRELARRESIPNITLSATVSRFEGDTLIGGDVGLPLPLFQRKAADIEQSVTERDRTQGDIEALEREIAQQVTEARAACLEAAADLEAFQREIVPWSAENLALERRLYQHGQVTAAELIGVQVDLLSARREYLDAVQAYNEALIELERVTGEDLKLL